MCSRFPQVTSFKGSKEFFDKVDVEDKTFTPFEVSPCDSPTDPTRSHLTAAHVIFHRAASTNWYTNPTASRRSS